MKNRDRLRQISQFDGLMKMQENLEHCNKANIEPCIMDVIGLNVTDAHYRHMKHNGDCRSCVQSFLNEEFDGRW